jgi:hypothetical protein
MIDKDDLEYYLKVFRDTTMTKRELEHNLRDAGLTRQMAKIISSKCGKKGGENKYDDL